MPLVTNEVVNAQKEKGGGCGDKAEIWCRFIKGKADCCKMADRPCKLGADIMRQCYYQISLWFFPAHRDHNPWRNGRERTLLCNVHRSYSLNKYFRLYRRHRCYFTSNIYLLLIHMFNCDILNTFSIEIQSIKSQMTFLSKQKVEWDGALIRGYSICSSWVCGYCWLRTVFCSQVKHALYLMFSRGLTA